jgi:hypothetical protein
MLIVLAVEAEVLSAFTSLGHAQPGNLRSSFVMIVFKSAAHGFGSCDASLHGRIHLISCHCDCWRFIAEQAIHLETIFFVSVCQLTSCAMVGCCKHGGKVMHLKCACMAGMM